MSLDKNEINSKLDKEFPNRNWAGKCEAARYQITRLSNGLEVAEMRSFISANSALEHSDIELKNRKQAPAGWVGFWDYGLWGHDMISLGNDFWVGATALGDKVADLGGGIKVIHGSTYPAKYLGATSRVGTNPKAKIEALPFNIPAGVNKPKPTRKFATNKPSAAVQRRIQIALRKRGRYEGPRNGIFGTNSWKGIQRTVANVGYDGPINGIPGERTCHFIQEYARKFGRYTGPINSILGPNSWEGFARGLEAGLK